MSVDRPKRPWWFWVLLVVAVAAVVDAVTDWGSFIRSK